MTEHDEQAGQTRDGRGRFDRDPRTAERDAEAARLRARSMSYGEIGKALKKAHEAVEKDEDHHLYHTKGWCRELAIQALGMPAVLPPPEEVKQVETAIGASRAEQQRDSML